MESYFEQNKTQWGKVLGVATVCYFLIVLTTLFVSSRGVRALPSGHALSVALGPFNFMNIQKTARTGGGYELDFSFQISLLVFFMLCYALATGVAIVLQRLQAARSST